MINSRNMNNSTYFLVIYEDLIYDVASFIGFYATPATAFVGLILNLFCSFILTDPKIKNKSYKYLLCKSIVGAAFCLINIGFQNSACTYCKENLLNSYRVQFYKLYVLKYFFSVLYMAETAIEFLQCYERYYKLKKSNAIYKLVNKLPVRYCFLILMTISMLLLMPNYFAYSIVYSNNYEKYAFYTTWFGKSNIYELYIIVLYGVFIISNIVGLNILNLLTVINLKQSCKQLSNISDSERRIKLSKSEVAFTKMIIITTANFSMCRLYNLVTIAISRIEIVEHIYFESATNLSKNLSYWLLTLNNSLNVLIFLVLNKNKNLKISNICLKYKQLIWFKQENLSRATN